MDTKCVKRSEKRRAGRGNNPSPCPREKERDVEEGWKKKLINEYRQKERGRKGEMFENGNLAAPSHERTYLAEDSSQVQRTYWRVNCAWIIKGAPLPAAVLCPFKMSPDLVNPLPGGRRRNVERKSEDGRQPASRRSRIKQLEPIRLL